MLKQSKEAHLSPPCNREYSRNKFPLNGFSFCFCHLQSPRRMWTLIFCMYLCDYFAYRHSLEREGKICEQQYHKKLVSHDTKDNEGVFFFEWWEGEKCVNKSLICIIIELKRLKKCFSFCVCVFSFSCWWKTTGDERNRIIVKHLEHVDDDICKWWCRN